MTNLLQLLDYSLVNKTYPISLDEQKLIDDYPTYLNDDWDKSRFDNLKSNMRKHYGRRVNRKCSYCRMTVNPDAYGNAIEHIVPRILKPQWMFVQNNLSISCIGCNSTKGVKNTLVNHPNNYGHSSNYCPSSTEEYKIFNPHFDKWSDHFTIEDNFFLVPIPNTKGPYTYKLCGMWRYQIVLDYIDVLKIREKSYRSLTLRLRKEKREFMKRQLENAMESIKDLIENN
ncbi:hypothetical protein F3C99_11425 [Vitellibacter sp. q18]|nr:hypothetical protein [Aequorivita lutea]